MTTGGPVRIVYIPNRNPQLDVWRLVADRTALTAAQAARLGLDEAVTLKPFGEEEGVDLWAKPGGWAAAGPDRTARAEVEAEADRINRQLAAAGGDAVLAEIRAMPLDDFYDLPDEETTARLLAEYEQRGDGIATMDEWGAFTAQQMRQRRTAEAGAG